VEEGRAVPVFWKYSNPASKVSNEYFDCELGRDKRTRFVA
jgi:hypothetical protein